MVGQTGLGHETAKPFAARRPSPGGQRHDARRSRRSTRSWMSGCVKATQHANPRARHVKIGPRTGSVSDAHLGRYMVQCLPAVCVLAGMGAQRCRRSLGLCLQIPVRVLDAVLVAVALGWIGTAALQHEELRREGIAFEQAYRIEPNEKILAMVHDGVPIVTIEPVLLHVLSEGRALAINLAALDEGLAIADIIASPEVRELLYVRRGECTGIDRARYVLGCRQLEELYEGQEGVTISSITDSVDLVRIPLAHETRNRVGAGEVLRDM